MATPYALSSDLVSAWPAKSLEVAQYVDGYKLDTGPVQNAQTGTTYTFLLTDTTKTVTANNSAASAYTVPPQSSVVWLAYSTLRILNLGAGVVTLTAGAGVTLTGTVTVAQYASATLTRTGSNAWTISGNASASGMDLITPTSVVGGTLSGGQISFSAVTEISVNGCFTSTYDNYFMEMSVDTIATAGNYITWRMRAAGTNVSSATYNFQSITASNASVGAGRSTGGTSGRLMYATLSESAQARIDCFNPARAFPTQMLSINNESVTTPAIQQLWNVNTNATAYDGLSFLCATAITGTLRIYGLRNL
jgi:hypothetical protein